MKKYLTLLLILLGTACAPVTNPPPTASPLPAPTFVPMAQIDLEPVLVVDGDLPADLFPDIIVRENAVGSAEELDRADGVFTQYFLLDGGEGGGVSVFLFESLEDVQAAFGKISSFMDAPLVYFLVGEQARIENFFIPLVADVPPFRALA